MLLLAQALNGSVEEFNSTLFVVLLERTDGEMAVLQGVLHTGADGPSNGSACGHGHGCRHMLSLD